MSLPSRIKQNIAIIAAILLVLLLLWRLHTRPQQFGVIGGWAKTNVFGPATLGLLNGSEPGESAPPQSTTNSGPTMSSNAPAAPPTNASVVPPSPNAPPPSQRQTLSTNLMNTNGPVTMIAVAPADLVETPPGVTSASNIVGASEIGRRLDAAGAKGGDIQISLSWDNFNDLDLHCIDPGGEEIMFSHPVSSRTGGVLDVDRNARPPYDPKPVENIYWAIGAAPKGRYKIFVVYYDPRAGLDGTVPSQFTVRTVVRGWKTYYFKSSITYSGRREPKAVCTLQYDPDNPDPTQRFAFVQ